MSHQHRADEVGDGTGIIQRKVMMSTGQPRIISGDGDNGAILIGEQRAAGLRAVDFDFAVASRLPIRRSRSKSVRWCETSKAISPLSSVFAPTAALALSPSDAGCAAICATRATDFSAISINTLSPTACRGPLGEKAAATPPVAAVEVALDDADRIILPDHVIAEDGRALPLAAR